MKLLRPLLICLAACLYAVTATAQWQWVDKDGRRVFSDRPPPTEVPEKNILKRPGNRGSAAVPAASAETVAPAAPAGVDKSLDAKKKQAEGAEAAKLKAEEERNARIRAENCARAQQAKAGLDTGGRMTRTNEKGEREFMDDAAIAAESQRLQALISENCR